MSRRLPLSRTMLRPTSHALAGVVALVALIATLATTPARAEPPQVVADIAPIHALLAQVMAGVAAPELLLEQDANPHSVQLRPSQARKLANADLVVWIGPGLSPWLAQALDGLASGRSLALIDNPATVLRPFQAPVGMPGITDGQGAAHDTHADQETHDDHGHADADPHLWLSIGNARAWLSVFAETLADLDPENAATYRANAVAATARLDALAARIDARLAPFQGAAIITFHASLGYFADRFGLTIAGSVRPSDATTPSAASLAALQDVVAQGNVRCAFAEPAFDPALLSAIAAQTGLGIGILDPTGALIAPGPEHFGATLEAISEAIATCLEASPPAGKTAD